MLISFSHLLLKKKFLIISILILSSATFWGNSYRIHHGQINDALLELLQAYHFQLFPLQYLVPTYPGGSPDFIESLVPYLNRFFWMLVPGYSLELVTFSWFFLGWIFTNIIFFKIIKSEISSSPSSLIVLYGSMILLASSALPGHIATILTRNGISLLWVSLSLWGYQLIQKRNHLTKGCLLIFFSFVAGIFSYTIFKTYFAAFFLAWLCLDWRTKKRWVPVIMAFIALLTYGGILYFCTTMPLIALRRGDYTFGALDCFLYAKRLWYGFLLPIYATKQNNFFLSETVHASFSRSLLSWPGSILFIWGIFTILREFRKNLFTFALLTWIFNGFFMAIAGPNIKYHYVTYLFLILIASKGLDDALRRFGHHRVKVRWALAFLLLFHVFQEWYHLGVTVKQSPFLKIDVKGGLELAQQINASHPSSTTPTFALSSWSIDSARYLTREQRYSYIYPESMPVQFLLDELAVRFNQNKNITNFDFLCQTTDCPAAIIKLYQCKASPLKQQFYLPIYQYYCQAPY